MIRVQAWLRSIGYSLLLQPQVPSLRMRRPQALLPPQRHVVHVELTRSSPREPRGVAVWHSQKAQPGQLASESAAGLTAAGLLIRRHQRHSLRHRLCFSHQRWLALHLLAAMFGWLQLLRPAFELLRPAVAGSATSPIAFYTVRPSCPCPARWLLQSSCVTPQRQCPHLWQTNSCTE
jgi:hypothetical protein